MKVLFICRANAGRSQMAEAFYNALTNTNDASSAGVDLKNSVKGDDPSMPELVVEVMRERGIDVSQKRRKYLTLDMVDTADRVVAIGENYELPEYARTSPKLLRWTDIPDAVRTPIEFHRLVRDMVEKRVALVVANG
jgi:arsenate reductase